jgi:hypothetical protein
MVRGHLSLVVEGGDSKQDQKEGAERAATADQITDRWDVWALCGPLAGAALISSVAFISIASSPRST